MATSNVPSNATGATENSQYQAWDAEQLRIQQSYTARAAANARQAAAAARAAEASFTNSAYGGMPPFTLNSHGVPSLPGPSKSTPDKQPRKRGR